MTWPERLDVVVEVSRGAHRKRRADGTVDFVSPARVPFNYGSALGTLAPDGDPEDAVIMGPALPVGTRAQWQIRGKVHFLDAGVRDDKWIVSALPLSRGEWITVRLFFAVYARAKRVLHRLRGEGSPTRYEGIERRDPQADPDDL